MRVRYDREKNIRTMKASYPDAKRLLELMDEYTKQGWVGEFIPGSLTENPTISMRKAA